MVKINIIQICTIAVVALLWFTLGQIIQEVYEKQRGSCPQDSLLWINTKSRNAIQCVLGCKQTENCFTITYGSVTRECKYYGAGQARGPLMGCTLASDSDDYVVIVKTIPNCGEPALAGYVLGTPTSTDVGGTVSVTCAGGFMCGSGVLTCLATGEWEQPLGCASSDDYMIGCYQDRRTRAFPYVSPLTPITPATCMQDCLDRGYVYAAVQSGFQCFCGSATVNYAMHGALDASKCEYACSGDAGQHCGGYWANMVYRVATCEE